MNFDRHTANRIRVGEITSRRLPAEWRTVTRTRRLKGGGTHTLPATAWVAQTRQPQIGRVIPITRPGSRSPIAHIEITGCHRAPHNQTLTPVELAALGHDTLPSYVRAWLLERDTQWLASPKRAPGDHDTTIDAAEAALTVLTDDQAHARFTQRWAARPVWVVTWEVLHDPVVFLRAGAPHIPYATRPSGRQMVDDGIRDEDRGWHGPGIRDVPGATDLADRGLVIGDKGADHDAGAYQDPDTLKWTWAADAEQRRAAARGKRDKSPGARRAS